MSVARRLIHRSVFRLPVEFILQYLLYIGRFVLICFVSFRATSEARGQRIVSAWKASNTFSPLRSVYGHPNQKISMLGRQSHRLLHWGSCGKVAENRSVCLLGRMFCTSIQVESLHRYSVQYWSRGKPLQKSAKPILAIPYLKSEPLFVHKTHKHTHTRALRTVTHTHARARSQNCHCESCCGMHLTCKNTSIDRNGSVKRPDKVSRSYHRHSQRRKDWIESWPFPFPVQKKNVKKSRLRQTCKPRNESVGEGFSAKPHATAVKNNLQVRHGDQPWYPHVLWPLRWTIARSTWMVPLQTDM